MPAGAAAYNIYSENTTKTIPKFRHERAKSAARIRARHRRPHFRRFRALGHQTEPRRGRPRGRLYVFYEPTEAVALGVAETHWRVEYLLELHGIDPPTPKCRPVLLAVSSRDRRRQVELDAAYHLLECDACAAVTRDLIDRRSVENADETRITITGVRIKTDQCAGQSFIRSYATLTSSTDNTDDVITYLGVTKAV